MAFRILPVFFVVSGLQIFQIYSLLSHLFISFLKSFGYFKLANNLMSIMLKIGSKMLNEDQVY